LFQTSMTQNHDSPYNLYKNVYSENFHHIHVH